MKTSELNFTSLLDQLSEEKINLVVDGTDVVAAGSSGRSEHSHSSSPAAVSSSDVPGLALGL